MIDGDLVLRADWEASLALLAAIEAAEEARIFRNFSFSDVPPGAAGMAVGVGCGILRVGLVSVCGASDISTSEGVGGRGGAPDANVSGKWDGALGTSELDTFSAVNSGGSMVSRMVSSFVPSGWTAFSESELGSLWLKIEI